MSQWFGASWQTIAYVVTGTVAMYLSTLIAARIAGRRTLAQLSAFDAIVTIAIGSLLASTSVSRDPSYVQGLSVLVTLLALQLMVAAARRRFPLVRRLVEFEPEVVLREGEVLLDTNPFGAQLTRGELESALRQHGVFDLSKARIVVLEPSGKLSVAGGRAPEAPLTP
ncbi:MAG TPA: YetF domain-containing protein [Acidimicrobiales bacterium]|nr:YetF domain-containing protein [Acidimicrobiales bacterium]